MKSIFSILNDYNVCYAIGVATKRFKSEGAGQSAKDYYVLVKTSDIKDLKKVTIANVAECTKLHSEAKEKDLKKELGYKLQHAIFERSACSCFHKSAPINTDKRDSDGNKIKLNIKTSEYSLSNYEVKEFKSNQDMFVKVQHDNNGKVYELKGNSFKDYYNLE